MPEAAKDGGARSPPTSASLIVVATPTLHHTTGFNWSTITQPRITTTTTQEREAQQITFQRARGSFLSPFPLSLPFSLCCVADPILKRVAWDLQHVDAGAQGTLAPWASEDGLAIHGYMLHRSPPLAPSSVLLLLTPFTSLAQTLITRRIPYQQRLMRDFKRLRNDPPQGVNGSPNPDNIMLWNAVIFGPEDTPWDGGASDLRADDRSRRFGGRGQRGRAKGRRLRKGSTCRRRRRAGAVQRGAAQRSGNTTKALLRTSSFTPPNPPLPSTPTSPPLTHTTTQQRRLQNRHVQADARVHGGVPEQGPRGQVQVADVPPQQ